MNAPLRPLYLDNHLLALDKPPGLPTQPAPPATDSLETRAKEWLRKEFQKPGNVFLEAVHRLDRDVGGVVLFARTSKAISRLNEQMRKRTIAKTYQALVQGRWTENEGELRHHLAHGSHRALVVGPADPRGKEAILHYRLLQHLPGQDASLLEIELITGRYHQIRAQLADHGHPVLGDAKYGATARPPPWLAPDAIALRHIRLACWHPTTQIHLAIEAPGLLPVNPDR